MGVRISWLIVARNHDFGVVERLTQRLLRVLALRDVLQG